MPEEEPVIEKAAPDPVLVDEWRAGAYRWLAQAFLAGCGEKGRGTPERLRELAWEAGALAEAAPVGFQELAPPLREASERLWRLQPEALEGEFRRVLGHTISKECPPYGTCYGVSQVDFQQSQVMADISGFFRAFGFQVSGTARERIDHVAVELEFMQVLAAKEAYARSCGDEEPAQIVREGEAAFMADHIGKWAPTFARRLRQRSPDGVYGLWGRVLDTYLEADARHLGVGPLDPVEVAAGAMEPLGPMTCGMSENPEEDKP